MGNVSKPQRTKDVAPKIDYSRKLQNIVGLYIVYLSDSGCSKINGNYMAVTDFSLFEITMQHKNWIDDIAKNRTMKVIKSWQSKIDFDYYLHLLQDIPLALYPNISLRLVLKVVFKSQELYEIEVSSENFKKYPVSLPFRSYSYPYSINIKNRIQIGALALFPIAISYDDDEAGKNVKDDKDSRAIIYLFESHWVYYYFYNYYWCNYIVLFGSKK